MGRQNEKDRRNNLNTYEEIRTVQVPDENLCKYCRNQLPPIKWDGGVLPQHTNGYCKAYPQGGESKPHDVLWGESYECEYFEEP